MDDDTTLPLTHTHTVRTHTHTADTYTGLSITIHYIIIRSSRPSLQSLVQTMLFFFHLVRFSCIRKTGHTALCSLALEEMAAILRAATQQKNAKEALAVRISPLRKHRNALG